MAKTEERKGVEKKKKKIFRKLIVEEEIEITRMIEKKTGRRGRFNRD